MSSLMDSIKYDAIISRFAEMQQTIDSANLERYHKIGELFDEFCDGVERNVYGGNTVQRLADDLQANGVLSDIQNPVRYLYWSRTVYQFDPSYGKLRELAKRGFSVTHAKLVFSLTDAVREKVLQALMSSDQVPSTRELESQLRITASSEAAQAVAELAKEGLPTPADPGDTLAPTTQTVPVDDTPSIPAPKAKETDKSEKAPKDQASKKDDTPKSDAAAHPLKAIKALEKLVSKMIIAIPDGFIAVTTAEKEGFDSDKAQKNYTTEVSNLRAAVDSAVKPLQELKKLLDDVKS
jgi:hypothetical protein